jgi:hypothetical protein
MNEKQISLLAAFLAFEIEPQGNRMNGRSS